MSEITNLRTRLKNNPHASAIISIIAYLNDPKIRESENGPFQALAVARILTERSLNWNGGSSLRGSGFNATTACVDGCDPGQGYCIDGWGPCPSPAPCPGEDTCGPTTIGASAINAITELAFDSGLDNPYTPHVMAFLSYIEGIDMQAPNAYVFFQHMVDEYYKNVSFISFFANSLKDGAYVDGLIQAIGGTFRTGYRPSGVLVTTVADGEPAVPGTRGDTIIQVISTDASIDTKYWTMYTSLTTRDIAWIDAGFGSGAPAVPTVPGVVDTYRQVVINPLGTPDAVVGEIITAFGGIPGYASIVQGPSDTVTFTVATGGLLPASDFTGLAGGTYNWIGSDVPGTDPVPGTDEVTEIDFRYASPYTLEGKWFKMWGEMNDGVLFYYEFGSNPIDPATLGTTYTSAVAIELTDLGCVVHPPEDGKFVYPCPTGNAVESIERITTDAILGTGLFSKIPIDGCCFKSGNEGCPGPHCNPKFASVLEADLPNSDGGTVQFGPSNQVVDVISPAGTNYGTAANDLDYARRWNMNVVPEMAALNRPTYYLKPVSAKFGNTCFESAPCASGCDPVGDPVEYCRCEPCPSTGVAVAGNLLLRTRYLSITDDIPFNVSGTNFQSENDCAECLM